MKQLLPEVAMVWEDESHHPFRLATGEPGADPVRTFNATSAASSLALLTYCPSYQYLADIF